MYLGYRLQRNGSSSERKDEEGSQL